MTTATAPVSTPTVSAGIPAVDLPVHVQAAMASILAITGQPVADDAAESDILKQESNVVRNAMTPARSLRKTSDQPSDDRPSNKAFAYILKGVRLAIAEHAKAKGNTVGNAAEYLADNRDDVESIAMNHVVSAIRFACNLQVIASNTNGRVSNPGSTSQADKDALLLLNALIGGDSKTKLAESIGSRW